MATTLGLAACQPPPPLEAEYVNEEYGFSIKYPAEYAEGKPQGNEVFRARSPAPARDPQVPLLAISILDTTVGATFAELKDTFKSGPATVGMGDVEFVFEKEITLSDGVTAAYELEIEYQYKGYELKTLYLWTVKYDKWFLVSATTRTDFWPSDKAEMKAVVHTFTDPTWTPPKEGSEKVKSSTAWEGTMHQGLTIEHDGVTRTFNCYVPNDLPDSPVPLVFILHGGGGSGDDVFGLRGKKAPWSVFLGLADADKFIVIAPDGSVFPDGARHWNDCRGDVDPVAFAKTVDDVGFIADTLITWASNNYNIDLERIYSTGICNGGRMSFRLARERSHQFAAIGVVETLIAGETTCPAPTNPISVLMQNGTGKESMMPWAGGRAYEPYSAYGTVKSGPDSVDYWVNHNGCDPTPEVVHLPDSPEDDHNTTVTEKTYGNGTQGTEVILHLIHDGGHVEASIQERYSKQLEEAYMGGLGWQNHDIETAVEIWNFLKRHGLNGPVTPPTPATYGFLNPTADAADTGGNDDGWEWDTQNAYTNGAGSAWNFKGVGDRHIFYNYGISVPAGHIVKGIQVRVDWGMVDSVGADIKSKLCVELSWDGGTSWTSQKYDTEQTRHKHAGILGSETDIWGRSWSASELSDANFRVRLETVCTAGNCNNIDYQLDWVAVKVHTAAEPTQSGWNRERSTKSISRWTQSPTHGRKAIRSES